MSIRFTLAALAASSVALATLPAAAQTTYTLKLANFAPAGASSGQLFDRYAREIKEKSGGRLVLQNYHGASMGPMPRHYDLARTGVADLAFFQHGATPGRFPLTELIHLPYMVRDSEITAKVLIDMLDGPVGAEHKGVRMLWLVSTLPATVFHATRPLTRIDDLKGQRVRAPTSTMVELLKAVGAVPVGVPPNLMAESLQKGTIDAVISDRNGVYSFKLGNLVKYEMPVFSAVLTFGLAMNPKSYEALPADLRKIIDGITGKDAGIRAAREGWTENPLWGAYLKKEGVQFVTLPPAADAEMRKLGASYAEKRVAELEKRGLPARQTYDRMRALARQYEK